MHKLDLAFNNLQWLSLKQKDSGSKVQILLAFHVHALGKDMNPSFSSHKQTELSSFGRTTSLGEG